MNNDTDMAPTSFTKEDENKEFEPKSDQIGVLMIDDNEDMLEVTSLMLTTLGYRVVRATHGAEAIALYKEQYNDIKIVILDLAMPKMDGRQCFRALKKINPSLKAILSTGYLHNSSVQEILNEGIVGFVQKPYHIQSLAAAVSAALSAPSPGPEVPPRQNDHDGSKREATLP